MLHIDGRELSKWKVLKEKYSCRKRSIDFLPFPGPLFNPNKQSGFLSVPLKPIFLTPIHERQYNLGT